MANLDFASSIIRSLVKIVVILIILLFGTNAIWIWYVNQYDFTTEYVEQEVTDIDSSSVTQTGVDN